MLIVAVAALVVVLDQSTKSWALHNLNVPRHVLGPVYLTLTFNKGAAFSVGTGISPIVEAVAIVLVVALIGFSRRMNESAPLWAYGALGLLLGGAIGNLIDRVVRNIPFHHGAVVDFIQAVSWWPVFNVADAAIVVGVVLLAVFYLLRQPSSSKAGDDTPAGAGRPGDG
jgi:signal peptidase II